MIAILALFATGCATGHLFDVGRRQESVLVYDRAFSDGRRLRLEYTKEVANRDGKRLRSERGAVRFDLAELSTRTEHAIDAFPFERVDPSSGSGGEQPVPLRSEGDLHTIAFEGQRLALRVRETDGRHVSLRLEGAAFEGAHPFRSGVLTRYRTAWWVYPLLPLAVTYDVLSAPVLALPAFPYFVMGE